MKNIKMTEIQLQMNELNIIDVREVVEYEIGHIPNAKNIPMNILIQNPTTYLTKEKTYHIVCQSGGRSQMVCMILDVLGFDVINVLGGTSAFSGKLQ